MSYFPSIPDWPRIPLEGTLFHNADTGTLCVKDRDGNVRELPRGPAEVWEYSGKPEPCGWCGHEFIPEGRRRVCANCGGPREVTRSD